MIARRRTLSPLLGALLLVVLTAACSDDGTTDGGSQAGGSPEAAASGDPESSQVSEDCPADTGSLTGYPPEGYGSAQSLTVCLYRTGDDQTMSPTWSAELGAEPAERVVRAVGLGRRTDCPAPGASDSQQVLLRVKTENDFGSEPLWHDYLVKLDECPSVVDLTQGDLRGGPTTLDVTSRTMAPWAGEGIADQLDSANLPDDLAAALG